MIVSIKLQFSYDFTIGSTYPFRKKFETNNNSSYHMEFIGTSRADGEYLFKVIKMGDGDLKDYHCWTRPSGSIPIISLKEVQQAPDGSMIVELALKNYDSNASKIMQFMMGYMNIPVDAMYAPDAYKSIIRDIKLKIVLDDSESSI